MSAAFRFVKEALFDLRSGLELAHLNSANIEAWLAKFSWTLIAAYSTGAECGIDLANDDPVDVFICKVNMYLQPFANEAWFLSLALLEKDRGNPGVLELNLYPYPFKTPTPYRGATDWAMQTRGYPLQNLAEKVTENCLMPVILKKSLFIVGRGMSKLRAPWPFWFHFTSPKWFVIYPSGIPETPETPKRGRGLWGVAKSVPLPLPPHTLQPYPWGFENPCPSLRASPVVSTIRSSAAGLGLCGPAAPLSSRLSSAAVSPVPSLLPAGSLAAVSPVAALPLAPLPSLLPLRQVQPTPSNSPAAVATTVPPSAARTSVIVEVAATAASSGSRRAHFEDLDTAEGEDEELPWICLTGAPRSHACGACFKRGDSCLQESDHYHKRLAQELALQCACRDPLLARAPRVARAPSAADKFEPSWDPCLDSPGPAYDILVSGHFYFPGLELASAALFWRSEVACAKGNYLGAKRHLQFAWSMLSDVLTRCIAPALGSPQTHHVQFSRPSTTSADLDATGPPDDVAPRGKGSSSSKGKGRAFVPMDEDAPEQPASPSDGGDGNRWDGILG
ncbi:hypothetical protein V8E53_003123 [Lactarius tabidus]